MNIIKKTTPASSKRKAETAASSAETIVSVSSAEKTESEIRETLWRSRNDYHFKMTDILDNTIAFQKTKLIVTGPRAAVPFREILGPVIDELRPVSEAVVRPVEEDATKYPRLVNDISAAEAKEKTLQKQLDDARTDLALTKGKVAHLDKKLTAVQARQEDLASTQGEVIRALAERLFRSKTFSALVADLIDLIATRSAADMLDKVAVDYPHLNKENYNYEATNDELIRTCAKVLVKRTAAFPVVEALACRRTLLSAEEVRNCEIDRDEEFEIRLAGVAEMLKDAPPTPEDEEEVRDDVATPGRGSKRPTPWSSMLKTPRWR